jgi:predicted Zn-dependent protease
MRRFDVLVGSSLALLAGFVGWEAWQMRAHLRTVEPTTASYGLRADTALADEPEVRPVESRRAAAAPTARMDASEVRRRLELSSHDTYIGDVIRAHDSALVRWPERNLRPLRVWVQSSTAIESFRQEFVPAVRRAFSEWSNAGIPMAFTFIMDSVTADVRVTWVDRFNEPISGKTIWAHDEARWITDAQIQLAVRHQLGERLDSTAVSAIALHEVGHLLGLDHTSDTTSIMAPRVRVSRLSPADRATVQLIYRLPPGRIAG